jgi:hypothetical protein
MLHVVANGTATDTIGSYVTEFIHNSIDAVISKDAISVFIP